MTDLTPEPTPVADPSDPRWTPPPGNVVHIEAPAIPEDGEVGQG